MYMQPSAPFVSVITPVYNGEKYLAECIESVLSQTYTNWDYTIVNNCSTDKTLEIVESYRKKDSRIKIINNDRFVGVIENHNIAFRNISSSSKYCKVVSADDWLYPECIEKLVRLAESNPSVGIVQTYVTTGSEVRSPGLPLTTAVFDGRQIGRLYLLGTLDFYGLPSSHLYRSSLVRSVDTFYPGSKLAPDSMAPDAAACLNCLQHCDFGVEHQILSFQRIHDGSVTARDRALASDLLDRLELVIEYGPIYLTQDELKPRLEEMQRYYYEVLATECVNVRGIGFWNYHKKRLAYLGLQLRGAKFGKAVLSKLLDLSLNPKQTIEKGLKRVLKSESQEPFRQMKASAGIKKTERC